MCVCDLRDGLSLRSTGRTLMDLDAVTFPALIIADDGWVEYLQRCQQLSVRTRLAITKYTGRPVLLYDSRERVWQVESIVPQRPARLFSKLLARTIYSPKVQVRLTLQPITEAPLKAVRDSLHAAIGADDDILTHRAEANVLKKVVEGPPHLGRWSLY
jgi:hypothetical protein